MGVKTRKYVRVRDKYDSTRYDQDAVDEAEIPLDAPTHCVICGDALTPLRRCSGRDYCTQESCLEGGKRLRTANWRMVNMHKQGETVVIVDADTVISTSKRGI